MLFPEDVMKILVLTFFFLILTGIETISAAYAVECIYHGQHYKVGDQVGPYVCMPDGTLQPGTAKH